VTEGNGTGLAITDLNSNNVGNKLGLLASSSFGSRLGAL